jgi:hypothetical protein
MSVIRSTPGSWISQPVTTLIPLRLCTLGLIPLMACESTPPGTEFPTTHRVQVEGTIRDSSGHALGGVKAITNPGLGFSPASAVTGPSGRYRLALYARITESLPVPDTLLIEIALLPALGPFQDSVLLRFAVAAPVTVVNHPEPAVADAIVELP